MAQQRTDDPEFIRAVQRLIGAPASGEFDTQTRDALIQWQAKEGLELSGKFDLQTVWTLEAEWAAALREDEGEGEDEDYIDEAVEAAPAGGGENWYVDLRRVKRTKKRGRPKRGRQWSRIDSITLHQTACDFGTPEHRGVINVPAHAMTFPNGQIALLNSPDKFMAHGHGFNLRSIGIELSALACGVEGVFVKRTGDPGPNTLWRPKSRPECDPVEVTDLQIEATKRLIRHYIELVESKGSKIRFIFSHRQSSNRHADPGSRIWQTLGLWAQKEFDLRDGPWPGFCIDNGSPIPTAWDARVEGVPYSPRYKGFD